MSNYRGTAIHPITKRRQEADWLDNYFGRREYGVRFVGEETVYRAKELPRRGADRDGEPE